MRVIDRGLEVRNETHASDLQDNNIQIQQGFEDILYHTVFT